MRGWTRRSFLYVSASMPAIAQNAATSASTVDHLLLGVSDLDRGTEWVERRTGVRPEPGGVHPGAGTRNALLSLGARRYLEVIAPDPAQATYNFPIDIRSLTEPRLITFAVATKDIESAAAVARRAGYEVVGPQPGSRRTPSGELLRWSTLRIVNTFGSDGVEPVPFFIEWSPDSPHPSETAPAGCELELLRLEHPDHSALATALSKLGIRADVSAADTARIIAVLKTPRGRVELR